MSAPCKVGWLTSELPEPDRIAFEGWATTGLDTRNRPVSARKMHQALRQLGVGVGVSLVKEHRAGTCACRKEAV